MAGRPAEGLLRAATPPAPRRLPPARALLYFKLNVKFNFNMRVFCGHERSITLERPWPVGPPDDHERDASQGYRRRGRELDLRIGVGVASLGLAHVGRP